MVQANAPRLGHGCVEPGTGSDSSSRILVHAGWALADTVAHASRARQLVRQMLPPGCERGDDVELVAAELAVNAATHSRARTAGGFAVELTVTRTRVKLTVHDPGGSGQPRLGVSMDPLAAPDLPVEMFEHGRGLALVDAHAETWGHRGDDSHRAVWAVFDLPHPLPDPADNTWPA